MVIGLFVGIDTWTDTLCAGTPLNLEVGGRRMDVDVSDIIVTLGMLGY